MQRWGTSGRQRLRLMPLYLAVRIADALASRLPRHRVPSLGAWPLGISVIIPERDAPAMLDEALGALDLATAQVDEPVQVIVVANGAPAARYDALRAKHPGVDWIVSDAPLGFAGAVERGLALARHGATYLLNNDMRLAEDALRRLLPLRAPNVFAIASQILQRSADGRREETGFTDWFVNGEGLHLFHAPVPDDCAPAIPQLCASGGATLFRTRLLQRYLPASRAYDPFYWEDAEWGLRAWRDGHDVLFCAASQATHRHRATTARFYDPSTLSRIVERNRLLFDLRHGASERSADELLAAVCALPYESQRELAQGRCVAGVARWRLERRRAPQPLTPPVLADDKGHSSIASSYSFRLLDAAAAAGRTRVLIVAPFAVFPPRHGGARRIAASTRDLKRDHAVALLGDESSLYDPRSFADFDGLARVQLVQRRDAPQPGAGLAARMRAHCHPALRSALQATLREWRPHLVVIEHAELAPLVRERTQDVAFVLDLHDAYGDADFDDASDARAFAADVAAFDAIHVCSDEDHALVTHPRVHVLPNGADGVAHRSPSEGAQVLFVGPFRYAPNREGILAFLRTAWPEVRARAPGALLAILGGDEALAAVEREPLLRAPGVQVHGHRDDVAACMAASALAINPLAGIRGSAIKLAETLAAGRVCVSTRDGARGFAGVGSEGLVIVNDASNMAEPVIRLLLDDGERHRREALIRPESFSWHDALARQRASFAELLSSR